MPNSPADSPTPLPEAIALRHELCASIAWFRLWYGPSWERRLAAAAGFGPRYISNRLTGNVRTDRKLLEKLEDLHATLLVNAGV